MASYLKSMASLCHTTCTLHLKSLVLLDLIVLNFPALQLSELVDKVAEVSGTVVSTSTMCRLLASHGLTRKKIQHVALQRRLDLRGSFVASTYPFSRNMFVYIDETGCKVKNMLRQYGFAGARPEHHSNCCNLHNRLTCS